MKLVYNLEMNVNIPLDKLFLSYEFLVDALP